MGYLNKITSLDSKDIIKNNDLKTTRLHSILRAINIINSKLDLNHVLKQVIQHALRLTNSVAASIILETESDTDLVIAYSTDLKSKIRFPRKRSIAGSCIDSGQIKVIYEPKNPQQKEIERLAGFKTKSILSVPLSIKGKTIGCIELINKQDNSLFNDEDITVAAIMSNLAAVSIRNAEVHEKLQTTNLALQSQLPSGDRIIGTNQEVQKIFKTINKLKDAKITVMILGESGTGKGVLARAIHEQSDRKNHPFITVNCSAFAQQLLESELFGHEKGAFTGADKLKKGRFELAHGGTVFLDEIGEMDASLQPKLLRVLHDKEFERVGGTETLTTDVRIISATNANLEEAIEQKSFRKDLYFRLKGIVFNLPPLRERREDISNLAEFFLQKFRIELNRPLHGFDTESMNALQGYDYPGNIRELENIVERAVVLAEDEVIHVSDLPDEIKHRKYRVSTPVTTSEKTVSFCKTEKETILETLEECGWNQSMTARLLGITRNKLRYRLKKYHLTDPEEN
ncbi:MAG: sigma-54-dependent Fis family transcriptional regulator [Candidatus Scalindua sp. AMX11]|nr:MAG: GAF domain-containing protein [Candidatus Scalindua sp.]NOG85689.1 sigma-54-dependent Fis family transcriptional regulator [Planctomycetota bacterium]RZV82418.1 MAG: sigma-54-dependent Fis family transcriptional regulator [Candidatus Scalindua sp. SCAELEC01]TDE65660.1 MAG: sigma-54-dependent Fis family transcriptional regulator [Candidatus Scalindua sp. AMX11]GJQ59144.1 MAG: Fis family transcriptional regulator [Candidatus Scalindua sp.]